MLCKKVELCNFRNAENETVEFEPGINVLHGENAQGKTNLLEAIYYVSLGKSFRIRKSFASVKNMLPFRSIMRALAGSRTSLCVCLQMQGRKRLLRITELR